MTAPEWIALAAVGATAVSVVVGYLNAREDRQLRERQTEHERDHVERLARANRHYASRLDAYREAGRQLARTQLYVQRIYPMLIVGEPEEPPPDFQLEELESLSARINTAASQEAIDALSAAMERVRGFQGRAMVFAQMEAQRANPIQTIEARRLMDESREVAFAAINDAQRLMREELRAL